MPPTPSTSRIDRSYPLWLALLIGTAPGCAQLVNPFHDDLPATRLVTTASAQRVQQTAPTCALRDRHWEPGVVQSQDPGVAHWPLWWSDFMEDSGSCDGRFAWTAEDYFALAYCPARQAVNTAAVPISMLVDPPGTIQCSDGSISPQTFGYRHHDPVRCVGEAILPDLVEAESQPVPPGGEDQADEPADE